MSVTVRFQTLLCAAMLAASSGCLFVSGSGSKGDVTFQWTLNGNACAVVPDVTQITIAIPGQKLDNQGVFGCVNSGSQGIRLLNFSPGSYSYTMEGRNNAGTILYSSSGTFIVNGDVTVNVTLKPNGGATGSATILWTFPPSGTSNGQPAACAQTVGPISNVDIYLDGATTPATFTCLDGQTNPGIRVDNLQPGSHTIELQARGIDYGDPTPAPNKRQLVYFTKTSTLQIVAGSIAAQQYSFDWAVGGLALKWTFSNGTTQLKCADLGLTTVYVNLRDSQGNYFPDMSGRGIPVPCSTNGVQGTSLPNQFLSYAYAGNYQIIVQAQAGAVLYRTNLTTPPTATITAGVFPVVDSTTQVVVLSP